MKEKKTQTTQHKQKKKLDVFFIPSPLNAVELMTVFVKDVRKSLISCLYKRVLHPDAINFTLLAQVFAVCPGGFSAARSWFSLAFTDTSIELPANMRSANSFLCLMQSELRRLMELDNKPLDHVIEAPSPVASSQIPSWRTVHPTAPRDPQQRSLVDEQAAWERNSATTIAEPLYSYWKEPTHVREYPRIADVAERVLSLIPSAVAAESLFSAAGFIAGGRRARIGHKRIDQQLFEHWNRRFGHRQLNE